MKFGPNENPGLIFSLDPAIQANVATSLRDLLDDRDM